MMKRHDVTITDIAKRMGLSVYTVSRALNGLSGVSESTRASVRETANEVGYIPNVNARDLRTGTHRFITLLTAGMSNSYYLDLIDGIESVLQDKKESLFMAGTARRTRRICCVRSWRTVLAASSPPWDSANTAGTS